MDFRTKIEFSPSEYKLKVDNNLLFVGSCFAENMCAKMNYYKFNSLLNPFGILYNPDSVGQCFDYLLSEELVLESD